MIAKYMALSLPDDVRHGDPQTRRQLSSRLRLTGPAPNDGADVLPGNAAACRKGCPGHAPLRKHQLNARSVDGHALISVPDGNIVHHIFVLVKNLFWMY